MKKSQLFIGYFLVYFDLVLVRYRLSSYKRVPTARERTERERTVRVISL